MDKGLVPRPHSNITFPTAASHPSNSSQLHIAGIMAAQSPHHACSHIPARGAGIKVDKGPVPMPRLLITIIHHLFASKLQALMWPEY